MSDHYNLLALSCAPGYRPGGAYSMECVPINKVSKYIEESVAAKQQPGYYKPTLLTNILNNPEAAVIGVAFLLIGLLLGIYFKQRRKLYAGKGSISKT